LDIPLKANVHCTDDLAGKVICVMIDPVHRQLTHIVVEEKNSPGLKRLVPVKLIAAGDRHDIHLHCSTAQLATLRPFMEIEYPREGALYFTYGTDEETSWPYDTNVDMPVPPELERLTPEAVAIHQNSPVRALDGRVGQVKGFLVNPAHKQLISIALETGYFWNKQELIVALAQVERFEEDRIVLKLDKHHLKRLVAFRRSTQKTCV
jgi:hypothetical protein